jgi:hypothetical protein
MDHLLVVERHDCLLQVADPAVDQLRASRARSGREIVRLDLGPML